VVWITGLSGAGKTTVAGKICRRLRLSGGRPLLLDGDVLRAVFGVAGSHQRQSRHDLAMSYARLCCELSKQGADVVCATVSMFHAVRKWNRDNIPRYFEIWLRVPLAELECRDPKGIYAAYRAGQTKNVVGLDVVCEEPASPDLIIENYGDISANKAAAEIVAALSRYTSAQ
jgi:cytidine diphosphoramidate kinase